MPDLINLGICIDVYFSLQKHFLRYFRLRPEVENITINFPVLDLIGLGGFNDELLCN